MKTIDIPLSKLTFAQKLNLMEALWDDITQDENHLDSPDWHCDVLKDREKAVKTSNAAFLDWESAKERIKRNIS